MHKKFFGLVAGLAVLLSTVASARALMIAPSPIAQRVANSKVVLVGKVIKFEDRVVEAEPSPGARQKMRYRIAIVKVQDPIMNPGGLTQVKVGVQIPPKPQGGGGRPIRPPIGRRYPQFQLKVGEEYLLFLKEHHKANFLYGQMYFDSVLATKKTAAIKKQIADAKKFAKLLKDPMKNLDSKSAETRFDTAAMMVMKYRQYVPNGKLVPIDAKVSKKILLAIANADWTKRYNFQELSPQRTFYMLGMRNTDGWTPPRPVRGQKNFTEVLNKAMQKWLKDNADKFVIKKYEAPKK